MKPVIERNTTMSLLLRAEEGGSTDNENLSHAFCPEASPLFLQSPWRLRSSSSSLDRAAHLRAAPTTRTTRREREGEEEQGRRDRTKETGSRHDTAGQQEEVLGNYFSSAGACRRHLDDVPSSSSSPQIMSAGAPPSAQRSFFSLSCVSSKLLREKRFFSPSPSSPPPLEAPPRPSFAHDDAGPARLQKNKNRGEVTEGGDQPCATGERRRNGLHKKRSRRGRWRTKQEYILTSMSYAVGLGNIWRFPYLCYENGGGAFLIAYVACLSLLGLPMFILESSVGQKMQTGFLRAWRQISAVYTGIGLSSVCLALICAVYYNVILSWTLFFFFNSFAVGGALPWTKEGGGIGINPVDVVKRFFLVDCLQKASWSVASPVPRLPYTSFFFTRERAWWAVG